MKYTPPGGTVTLSVTAYHMFCCIQVSDTGPGIPEEEQAQIFSRFYRGAAVREQEGLGLGLYLTRRILTSEGGDISGCPLSRERAAPSPSICHWSDGSPAAPAPEKSFSSERFQKECGKDLFARMGTVKRAAPIFTP